MYSDIINAVAIFTAVLSALLIILFYILTALGYMKCMEKAGVEKWKAWVPFYNDIVMYKIVGLSPWLATINIIKSGLAIITAVIGVLTLGSLKEDLNDVYEKELKYSNSGYYYKYDDSSVERIARKYNKTTGANLVIDGFETIFSIGAFVIGIFFAIYITKAYGLSGGYIAGMILVPHIFILIIGYGKSEYLGRYSMSSGTVIR